MQTFFREKVLTHLKFQLNHDLLSISKKYVYAILLMVVIAIALFYRWDIFFYDGIYYLRFMTVPNQFTPGPLQDRWTHVNFLWWLTRVFSGGSAFDFHVIQNIYRILMYAAILVWWRVFCYFIRRIILQKWALFFALTSPLLIYAPHQVVPDQWALLFMGLGFWAFLKSALEKNRWLPLIAGGLFYLGFLSRSDSPLLPFMLFISCFAWGFPSRKNLILTGLLTACALFPLLGFHISKVGIERLAPMLSEINKYPYDNLMGNLEEYWNAAGLQFFIAFFALACWREKGVRILFTATFLIYFVCFTWIFTGHVAIGRQTIQGVIILTAVATIGFSVIVSFFSNWLKPAWVICALFLVLIPLNVTKANQGTAGIETTRSLELFHQISADPGTILLVSDDPTYYFYRFYFPESVRKHVFLCYAGGPPEMKKGYQKTIEKQLGPEYLSSMEELTQLKPKKIIYLGTPDWTWISLEPNARFVEVPELGKHKGYPIYEVHLDGVA